MTLPTEEETAAAERFAMNIALPSEWIAAQTTASRVYYVNDVTGESSMVMPAALPHGWSRVACDASHATHGGMVYFRHAASNISTWERPSIAEHERAVAVAEAASGLTEVEAADAARAKERVAAGRAKRDAVYEKERARARAQLDAKKKVRFKWSPRVTVSLADALLGTDTAGSDEVPPYLSDVCRCIFAESDRKQTGTLNTLDVVLMLEKRANISSTSVVFDFKKTLHAQAESNVITAAEFERGIIAVLRNDERGPVAQWVLRELQDLAAEWVEIWKQNGEMLYAHPTLGSMQTKPALVAAIEHFESLLREAGLSGTGGTAAPLGSSSSSSSEDEAAPEARSGATGRKQHIEASARV